MNVKVRLTDANDLVSGHSPEQDLGQNMAKRQVLHTRCVYQVVTTRDDMVCGPSYEHDLGQ